jgi:hypothetical protein
MRKTVTRRATGVAGSALAIAMVSVTGPLAGVADAAPGPAHALKSTMTKPAPVSPGAGGTLHYEVTNVSPAPTDGVLLNVSLPRYVALPADRHCQQTGHTPDGGTTISCNMSDELGKFAPGQTRVSNQPFQVSPDAPRGATLGRIGALVVPLKGGKPTEDWHNLTGYNTSWTTISTR